MLGYIVALTALLFILPTHSAAQYTYWVQTNPFDGSGITAVAFGPNGRILAGSASDGILYSLDNGESWIEGRDSSIMLYLSIRGVAIREDGAFFVGAERGEAYRSTDNGQHWTVLPVDLAVGSNNVHGFDFNTSGHVFASAASGIYRSTNSGDSWKQLRLGSGIPIGGPIVIDANDNIITAVSRSIHVSNDNGDTWQVLYDQPNGSLFQELADAGQGVLIGTAAGRGILRSTDGGASWSESNAGLTYLWVRELAVGKNGSLYASADSALPSGPGGLFRSTDRGASWHRFDFQRRNRTTAGLAVGADGDVIIAVIEEGQTGVLQHAVYRTMNEGRSWERIDRGLRSENVGPVAADSSGIVYAALAGGGIARTTDRGATWSPATPNPSLKNYDMLVTPRGAILVGTGYNGVLRSTDNGISWSPSNTGMTDSIISTLAINADGTIYARRAQRTYWYASDDDGVTWIRKTMSFILEPTIRQLANGDRIALSTVGPQISTDNGTTWSAVSDPIFTGFGISDLLTSTDGVVLGWADGSNAAMIRSSDNGRRWSRVLEGSIIEVVENRRGVFFAAAADSTIYRSTDRGATWEPITDELPPFTYPRSITVDAEGFLYASMWNDMGVWRSIETTAAGVPQRKDQREGSVMLDGIHPNPNTGSSEITFSLQTFAHVRVVLTDPLGRHIATLVNRPLHAGRHSTCIDAASMGGQLPTGTYIVTVWTSIGTQSRSFVVIR